MSRWLASHNARRQPTCVNASVAFTQLFKVRRRLQCQSAYPIWKHCLVRCRPHDLDHLETSAMLAVRCCEWDVDSGDQGSRGCRLGGRLVDVIELVAKLPKMRGNGSYSLVAFSHNGIEFLAPVDMGSAGNNSPPH
jgi:hypothetical protein